MTCVGSLGCFCGDFITLGPQKPWVVSFLQRGKLRRRPPPSTCKMMQNNESSSSNNIRLSATSMSPVADFLKETKQAVLSARLDGQSNGSLPHLVLGNPAGDADSIISAICLAYVDSKIGNKGEQPSIPIVSIPWEDLKSLRPESTFLLTNCAGIDDHLEDLIAIDQTDFLPSRATLTLVDHNHHFLPSSGTSSTQHQQEWTVTEIVDHHLDENEHLDTCPHGPHRNIAFEDSQALVASTCTLIVERFYALVMEGETSAQKLVPPSLAILLLGVILLDSINMLPQAGKGTPRDGDAIQKLLSDTDWTQIPLPDEILDNKKNHNTPDPTKLFECLQAQKFSPKFWKGLTAMQGIKMDYKSFLIPSDASATSSSSSSLFGISTILLDMETFWRKDNVLQTMAQFIAENNLKMLGLMFTYMQKAEDGQDSEKPCRQLALASTDRDELERLVAFLMDDGSDIVNLQLSKQDEVSEEKVMMKDSISKLYVIQMDQHNSAASRKQVAPAIMGFWKDQSHSWGERSEL